MSFKRLPPWVFGSRERVDQLVCTPRGFIRAWQADGRPLWAPCLAWAPGPVVLADTGAGDYASLSSQSWLAQVCEDGSWVLYRRLDSEALEVVPWDVVPPQLEADGMKPTLAFDQAARPAIAWEQTDGIHLREFDEIAGAYQFIGPFAGVDPVLLNDMTVNYHVGGSDVVLFYLSPDRLTLRYRIQSENFATEHDHYTFSSAMVLDASDIGGYQFQLKISDEQGAVIPSGAAFVAVLSDVYPIYVQERMSGAVGTLGAGDYVLVVLTRAPATESMGGAVGSLGDGLLFHVIITRTLEDSMAGVVGSLGDGVLFNAVIQRGVVSESMTGSVGGLGDGVLLFVIIQRSAVTDAMSGAVGALGDGDYAAA